MFGPEEFKNVKGPEEFTKNWFQSFIAYYQQRHGDDSVEEKNRTENVCRDYLQSLSAFIHLLLLCETDDPQIIRQAVLRIRRQFLEAADFENFPVPVQSTFVLWLKKVMRAITKRVTLYESMPRVWLYHRCFEAVWVLSKERKQAPAGEKQAALNYTLADIPNQTFSRAEKCVAKKEATRRFKFVPDGVCPCRCRPLFLKWMGFSEAEVGAALDMSRLSARRLSQECDEILPATGNDPQPNTTASRKPGNSGPQRKAAP